MSEEERDDFSPHRYFAQVFCKVVREEIEESREQVREIASGPVSPEVVAYAAWNIVRASHHAAANHIEDTDLLLFLKKAEIALMLESEWMMDLMARYLHFIHFEMDREEREEER